MLSLGIEPTNLVFAPHATVWETGTF